MDLPRLPARHKKYADVYVWTFVNFSETMPGPVSPMGWSLMEAGLRRFLRPLRLSNDVGYTLFEFLYGRVFWNLTPVFGSRLLFDALDRNLAMIGPSIRETMKEILRSGRVRPRPIYSISQKLILALQMAFLIPWIGARLAVALIRPGAVERGLERLEVDLRALDGNSSTAGDWRASVRDLERYLDEAFTNLKRRFGVAGLMVMAVTGLFVSVAGRLMKARNLGDTLELLAPSRPSKTVEADLALWELSRSSDGLTVDSPAFTAWLDRFGHRCPGEQDAITARPWDDPARALELVRQMARESKGGPSPADRFNDRARSRRAAAESRLRSLGPIRRLIAGPLHRAASRYLPFREDGKHYVMLVLGHARRRLEVLGRGLEAAGFVDDAEDVFFLTLPELSRLESTPVRALIAERRAEFTRYRDVRPPLVVTSEGIPATPSPPGGTVLRGDPVSSGIVKGRARVVLDPVRDGELHAGEILVAPHTDPGWTPLFLRAAGVVTEVGGALSHGAVVAREFGLPAVVNVLGATTLLKTGDMIEVDGNRGEVRKVD